MLNNIVGTWLDVGGILWLVMPCVEGTNKVCGKTVNVQGSSVPGTSCGLGAWTSAYVLKKYIADKCNFENQFVSVQLSIDYWRN